MASAWEWGSCPPGSLPGSWEACPCPLPSTDIFLEFGENVFLGELGLRRFVACFPLVEIQSPGVVLTVTNYSRIMFLWQYNPPQILGASNLFASISGNYVQSTVLVVALQLTCLWFLVLFSLSLLRVS